MFKELSLRTYVLLWSLFFWVRSWAQSDDDDDFGLSGGSSRGDDDLEGMNGFIDYQPIHFGITDIVMVVFLLVCCYVFGKIWKGCSYMILVLAALFYYITRY